MKIIGLTGGIASGKSTVSRMIQKMGLPVICADKLAREVVNKGKPAYHQIIKKFGKEILLKNGQINRPLLGKMVFANAQKRKQLNRIVHPYVIDEMKNSLSRLKKKGAKIVFLDVPLLFETELDCLCDRTMVVYAPEKILKRRLQKRDGLNAKEIENRLASQMSIESKLKKGDWVIDNSQSRTKTEKQLLETIQLLIHQRR